MSKRNLTRKEISKAIHDKLGYPKSSCIKMVDAFLTTMKSTLIEGEPIKLIHFGTFNVKDKRPRKGRNPQTGEEIIIKERQMINFRPSKKFRQQINE